MLEFSRKQTIITAAAAGLIAVAAIVVVFAGFDGTDGGKAQAGTSEKNYAVYKDDHTMGSPDAPIVMIEYGAPTCPHCAHFDIAILPQVKKNYIDTGKVYYIFRAYPLSAADGAVEAVARSLPKEKYFPFIDLIFHNQPKWDPEYGIANVRDALIQVSAPMGVSAASFDRSISNPDVQDQINRIAQDGQMKYGITAVPAFVINGTVVQSPDADWPQLKARFDTLLSRR